MTTSFSTTELDFNEIKNELKTYLARQSEFADYDFEASGLSNILDVLAYNTHFNALLSNFALNEAYLKSAQLRSSVVNIGQTLGYNIRSKTTAVAYVNLSLNLQGAGSLPTSITIPSGTKFTSSVDGVSYTFQTRSPYTASNDGTGVYVFYTSDGSADIPIYEGTSRTKVFIVQESNERQIFVIPDETIDTQTMTVRVYDTYSSTSYTAYTDIALASSLSENSTVYKVSESPNGYYEVGFGDGITTGQKPIAGNKVQVEYLSTQAAAANSAVSFTPVATVTINSINYPLITTTIAAASSGAERQSIESIRENAPLSFAAQRRLVTPDDYKTTILSRFSNVTDVAVWGGEDNVPQQYGSVFISLLFSNGTGTAAQEAVKSVITNTLNENLGVLSIYPEYVDAEPIYLNINTAFRYNPTLTTFTRSTLETRIAALVSSYFETNLNSFSGVFRKSRLLNEIDEFSDAVLSSEISVTMQKRLTTTSGVSTYSFTYPAELKTPDDVNYIVTSSRFYYDDEICLVRNKLNDTKLQVVTTDGAVRVDNVGSYTTSGTISLVGFNPGADVSGSSYIRFMGVPANDNTITPRRKFYFAIDTLASTYSGTIDQNE